jgi:hypothetical protein
LADFTSLCPIAALIVLPKKQAQGERSKFILDAASLSLCRADGVDATMLPVLRGTKEKCCTICLA